MNTIYLSYQIIFFVQQSLMLAHCVSVYASDLNLCNLYTTNIKKKRLAKQQRKPRLNYSKELQEFWLKPSSAIQTLNLRMLFQFLVANLLLKLLRSWKRETVIMLYPVALKIFNRRYIVTKSKVISGKLYLKLSYILRHHSIFELAKLQYFSLFESI